MTNAYTAIIHFRPSDDQSYPKSLQPTLQLVPGVDEVLYEPGDRSITVNFDSKRTGLSDLVRTIEEMGVPVSGVAQRRSHLARTG